MKLISLPVATEPSMENVKEIAKCSSTEILDLPALILYFQIILCLTLLFQVSLMAD